MSSSADKFPKHNMKVAAFLLIVFEILKHRVFWKIFLCSFLPYFYNTL